MALGGGRIALSALRNAQRPGPDGLPRDIRHFAIAAASAAVLQRWKQRLRAHDVSFEEEDHGAQRSIYFEDPNGHLLEITAPPSGASSECGRSASEVVRAWIASR